MAGERDGQSAGWRRGCAAGLLGGCDSSSLFPAARGPVVRFRVISILCYGGCRAHEGARRRGGLGESTAVLDDASAHARAAALFLTRFCVAEGPITFRW